MGKLLESTLLATCVFVSTPDQIIKKWGKSDEDIAKYGEYDFIDWNYKHNTNKAG